MSFSAVDQTLNPVSMATYKRGMAELIIKVFGSYTCAGLVLAEP